MSTARRLRRVSADDYLDRELRSRTKHEFVDGMVYAMVGGTNAHNLIAGNVFGSLHGRLRGKRCRPYNSETRIRVRSADEVRFYYPDASVICRSNPQTDLYQDEPAIIAEVLSRKTRRLDEGEKRDAYLSITSLAVYLLIEQQWPAATVYRRTDRGSFVRETYVGQEAVIALAEVGAELPLADVYEGVQFGTE